MRYRLTLFVFSLGVASLSLARPLYNRAINVITTNYDLVDTTYVDRGRIDGIKVGDKFEVNFRSGKTVTQVVVTSVFERMAAVKIVDSWLLKDGQVASFKQRSQFAAQEGTERRPSPDIKIDTKNPAPAPALAEAPLAPATPDAPAAPAMAAPEMAPAPLVMPSGVPDMPPSDNGLPSMPGETSDNGLPAMPGGPDAGLPPAPGDDAGLPPAPGLDAGLPPAPDAGLPPAPGLDAGLPPAPGMDAAPAPDAELPPPPPM